MTDSMVVKLLRRLDDETLKSTDIIPWSSPVLSFGDVSQSTVATLGLNPSNREFVDANGIELDGDFRRFHTLKSFGLNCWTDARPSHRASILEACRLYFARNPYDTWFRRLDYLLAGLRVSYYSALFSACHLDLVPYATAKKWTELSRSQRTTLLESTGDTLGHLLRDSRIRILILNGKSVVEHFSRIADVELTTSQMSGWTLRRAGEPRVTGTAYNGFTRTVGGVRLRRPVHVLGFNHNIQSSFGITKEVALSIRTWITRSALENPR